MARPTLIIISGPSGMGKTTLAHELARAIPCIAICRDEIKEGMVHAADSFEPALGDELTERTYPLFFEVLELLLRAGVTVVAEAAFQDARWRRKVEPLMEIADVRVVQCHTDAETARHRVAARERTAHADTALLDDLAAGRNLYEYFVRLDLAVPSIDVDTTSGYAPPIEELVAFVTGPASPP
jgi:predicted kinase